MRKKSIEEYDLAYFAERNSAMPHVKNVIFNLLKKHKVKKILEVAPGAGDLMRTLKKKGYSVKGIDISATAAKLSGSIIGSATDMPFQNESFDCVLGLSIIEHLNKKDGIRFAKEIYRVLKRGGIVFLLTPNFASPMRILHGKNWYGYSDPTHIQFYTPSGLTSLLEKESFEDVSVTFKTTATTFDWPLPGLQKLPKKMKLFINILLISTPLAVIRDSLWIFGRKSH